MIEGKSSRKGNAPAAVRRSQDSEERHRAEAWRSGAPDARESARMPECPGEATQESLCSSDPSAEPASNLPDHRLEQPEAMMCFDLPNLPESLNETSPVTCATLVPTSCDDFASSALTRSSEGGFVKLSEVADSQTSDLDECYFSENSFEPDGGERRRRRRSGYRGGRIREDFPPEDLREEERTKWQRQRFRKDTHNDVEKRRRNAINGSIEQLGRLVPNTAAAARRSKGSILRATIEFVCRSLRSERHAREALRRQRRLLRERSSLASKLKELDELLQSYGVDSVPGTLQLLQQTSADLPASLSEFSTAFPTSSSSSPTSSSSFSSSSTSFDSLPSACSLDEFCDVVVKPDVSNVGEEELLLRPDALLLAAPANDVLGPRWHDDAGLNLY